MSVIDEIKQQKPFPSKEQEAAVTLLRTADVLRRRHDDMRCVDCHITPAGRGLLDKLDAPVRAAAGRAFHDVNRLELAQLVQALDQVRQSLRNKEESS